MQFGEREDEDDLDRADNPVPPPRRKGKRQSAGSNGGGHANRMDSGGGGPGRGRDKRHTLHSSMSSSRLLDHLAEDDSSSASNATLDSIRSARTLPSFSNLSDAYGQGSGMMMMDRDNLRQYSRSTDIGLLRKSASGAHLILDDEPLSRKCSETSLTGGMVFRQSSGVDSTPPQSPQSKYSFSSRDSIISDSSQGALSRDSSVTSAPQTPDTEYADRLPPWMPSVDCLDYGADRRLAFSLNLASGSSSGPGSEVGALSASDSAAQLRAAAAAANQDMALYLQSPSESPVSEVEDQDFTPLSISTSRDDHALQTSSSSPSSSSSWQGRSREAEDVPSASPPQIHVTQCSSRSEEKLDESFPEEATPRSSPSSSADMLPLEIPHGHGFSSLPVKQMSKYSQNLAKVSPPPRVLLQSLRSPRSGRDPAPVRASHDSDIVAQVQRAGYSSPRLEDSDEDGKLEGDHHRSGLDAEDAGSSEEPLAFTAPEFDAAQSMEDAINDAEYFPVKPKLTIIRREESILSNASSQSSASSVSSGASLGTSSVSSLTLSTSPSARSSSSSSGSSSVTVAGDQARPSRPPEYREAVERSWILKQEAEAQAQIEASRKAKHLFENSMQRYLQDRRNQTPPLHTPLARKISDPGTTRNSSVAGAHGRYEGDHPRSMSPDFLAAPSLERSSYVDAQGHRASGKQAWQIYQESLHRYEQQQTAHVETSGLTARTAEPTARTAEPTTRTTESPAKTTESTRTAQPSTKTAETPVKTVEPPTRIAELSARTTEPPVRTTEPPVRTTEPPVRSKEPARAIDSPVSFIETESAPSPSPSPPSSAAAAAAAAKGGHGVAEDRTKHKAMLVADTRVQLRSANSRTNVPKEGRPRSMLDIPSPSSLHRSFSDSADRINKLGVQPQNPSGGWEAKEAERPSIKSVISAFSAVEQSRPVFPGRKLSDTSGVCGRRPNGSDPSHPSPRSSVLTASCFYHPDDSPRSGRSSPAMGSPRAPSPRPELGTPRARANSGAGQLQAGRAGIRPRRSESPVARASRVFTASTSFTSHSTQASSSSSSSASVSVRSSSVEESSSRVSVSGDTSEAASASVSSSKSRSHLGWSVKNLAKIYNADSNAGSEQSPRDAPSRGSPAASGNHGGPPPYQNPPPFRRLQDKSRLSTSSSSSTSTASSSTTRSGSPTLRASAASSRKEGPQNASAARDEVTYGRSTRWARARSGTGSDVPSDQEATNPFTDISYV